jgi:hypothetical protein
MNRPAGGDDPGMAHFVNAVCGSVLIYASVTRGALMVARGLTFVAARRAG